MTTNLKAPVGATTQATTTAPAPTNASAYGFVDMDEAAAERAEAAAEARSAEQSRGLGGNLSPWQEGVPQHKSGEGVKFLRLIQYPGKPNLVPDVDDPFRLLPRWHSRYKVYHVVNPTTGQDSGPVVCRPGEDLLLKARIELFKNATTSALFKTEQGKTKQFDITCSERIVFLGAEFDGRNLGEFQILDLPVSRPKNKNKPNDMPKLQVGDTIRDLPKVRDDDPVNCGNLPEGTPPPLRFGPIYSIEKGRLLALTTQGKGKAMQRSVEAKSVYPLGKGGALLPQFEAIIKNAFQKFGSKPLEEFLRYSSKEDQINAVKSLAPAPFIQVALNAMGVKDVPVTPAAAPALAQTAKPQATSPAALTPAASAEPTNDNPEPKYPFEPPR